MDALLPFDEYLDVTAPITRLYIGWFNRLPDAEGLAYWANRARAGEPIMQTAQSFEDAAPELGELADDAFVALVYERLLGRTPDVNGASHYVDGLRSSEVTRSDVMLLFSQSDEAITFLRPRVLVSAAFIGLTGVAAADDVAERYVARLRAGEADDLVIADIVLGAAG
jgi:hypothetical protein